LSFLSSVYPQPGKLSKWVLLALFAGLILPITSTVRDAEFYSGQVTHSYPQSTTVEESFALGA